ncbi:MAG: methyl-accepting chemotaxis protein, partial [Pseudomonadota bacterium]
LVDVVSELAELNQNLQVERGRTAGLIGRGGAVNQVIIDTRAKVDAEAQKYHLIVERFAQSNNTKIIKKLKDIDDLLLTIPDFRKKVDAGTATLPENMAFYSGLIDEILHVGFLASEMSSNVVIALEIVALLELGEAKEFAGRERGLVYGGLNKGKLSDKQFLTFNKDVARQDLMTYYFISSWPAAKRAEYEKMLEATGIDAVNKLRQRIIDRQNAGLEFDVSPNTWFETTTKRINGLRGIEQKALGEVREETVNLASENMNAMIAQTLSVLALLVAAMIGAYYVARSINGPLSALSASMEDISNGNLDVSIAGQNLADEIGDMSRALQVFKENAEEKIRMEAEAGEARSASERERSDMDAQKAKHEASVSSAVAILGEALDSLAKGDLSVQIDTQFEKELDDLRINFNSAVGKLSSTLQQVKSSIDTISTGADEMKIASAELSTRTEQQAHSLQDVTTALDQITKAVDGTAMDSSSASGLANKATEDTGRSLEVVNKAVEAMSRIETASSQISSIISVIDEITFQTNLLALNAGVEAARAGDAGKGFAVVAQEVRELAHRSASSANEIKELINASSTEVQEGVKHVSATGEALMAISEKINEITNSVQSIAGANQKQSESLNDCSESAANLDRSTQQNAAMAEETTAVMQNLARDSSNLANLIESFKLLAEDPAAVRNAA